MNPKKCSPLAEKFRRKEIDMTEKSIEKEKKTKSKEQLTLDRLVDKFGQEAVDASVKD